jgi:hypothetical protein
MVALLKLVILFTIQVAAVAVVPVVALMHMAVLLMALVQQVMVQQQPLPTVFLLVPAVVGEVLEEPRGMDLPEAVV